MMLQCCAPCWLWICDYSRMEFCQIHLVHSENCALFPILLAVLPRAHSHIALKYLHKISVIIIAKLHRNILDGRICGQQKLLCPQNPLLRHIFQHRHVGLFFEKTHHVLRIQGNILCKLRHGKRLREILVNVR